MLFNPVWDKPKVKADPLSLESLIAWLEMQSADKAYDYASNRNCLLGQYFTACGFEKVLVGVGDFYHGSWEPQFRETIFISREFNSIAHAEPYTFGAALIRAKDNLAQEN